MTSKILVVLHQLDATRRVLFVLLCRVSAHPRNARVFLLGTLKGDHLTALVLFLRHDDLVEWLKRIAARPAQLSGKQLDVKPVARTKRG